MLRNMIRGAAVFFAVGLAIGLLAPYIAPALISAGYVTAAQATISPLWNGITFGLFGGMVPPVQKIWDNIFGAEKAPNQDTVDALTSKVIELDGRGRMLEQALEAPAPSRTVQNILAAGSRTDASTGMRDVGLNAPSATTHVARVMDSRNDALLHNTQSATVH